ncbi:IS3 family transposase [Kocuria rosea]|uniref:IS3 family transposase n=1 Tax=Kocuria rosea TaxID=1275 RepID=UPI0018D2029C
MITLQSSSAHFSTVASAQYSSGVDTWADHRRVYGARRLTAELRHRGLAWNRKKVAEVDAS